MLSRPDIPEDPIALLMVHGGASGYSNGFLALSLEKISENTTNLPIKLYVYNYKPEDEETKKILSQSSLPLKVIEQTPDQDLPTRQHSTALQRLFDYASRNEHTFAVMLDSDTIPIQPDWLDVLITSLQQGYVLAGIWRDELHTGIKPYCHPSCMAFRASFLKENGLRLHQENWGTDGQVEDTLSHLTRFAETKDLPIYKLKRSNQNNFHFLIGGLYNDLIYHHGAGSRLHFGFHGRRNHKLDLMRNQHLHHQAAKQLFTNFDRYIEYLKGKGKLNIEYTITDQVRDILSAVRKKLRI